MPTHDFQGIRSFLAQQAHDGADASGAVAAVAATWQAVDMALRPVLGQRGVAALYGRCMHVAGAAHPWLDGVHANDATAIDVEALTGAFALRAIAEIRESGDLLLRTLHGLLASLIGLSLTDRLLAGAAAHLADGMPVQDPSP